MNATPRTLRSMIVRSLGMGMIVFLCAASYLVSNTYAPTSLDLGGDSAGVMDIRESIDTSMQDTIKSSGCVYPQGTLPASVVADPAGERSWTHMTSERALGQAFEQLVFDGVLEANEFTKAVDHGMRVGAFCK